MHDHIHRASARFYAIEKTLHTNDQCVVLLARHNGLRVVLKGTTNTQSRVNLKNEVEANMFLRRNTPRNAPFVFPEEYVIGEDDAMLLVRREHFDGRLLYDRNAGRPATRSEDIAPIFEAMAFLHGLSEESIPEPFRARARTEYTHEKMLERMKASLVAARTIVSADEADGLLAIYRDGGDLRRFVHHDFQTPNLIRLADGRVGVMAAEFARWGMKWYDVAYAFLQSEILYDDRAFARKQFVYNTMCFLEMTHEDPRAEIFAPLAYRLSANLALAVASKDVAHIARARRVLDRVLKRDLDGLVAP